MTHFKSGGLRLAYDDIQPEGGTGTVVLVHGFASNRMENWRRVGWYGAFERAGYRILALDLRGHGLSDKPHEPDAYALSAMAGDILALMDHAGAREVDLMGYSLGARLAIAAMGLAPHRFTRLVLGGVGDRLLSRTPAPAGSMTMAEALTTADPAAITSPILRGFRQFADNQGEDRLALAACAKGQRTPVDAADLDAIAAPTLVIAGLHDDIAGDPCTLADAIPGAKSAVVPGCDHFSAIPHALFKAAVFDFLEGWEED